VLLLALVCCQWPVRLYEGQADAVARLEVKGDGRLSVTANAGDVAWEASLVGFDGSPLHNPVHRAEVLPGRHTLQIRVRRYEMPWIARWRDNPQLYWIKTDDEVHEVELDMAGGVTYWLDWIPEWREDRPPGPPMLFRTR
jgi:hypothetical protein